MSSSVLYMSMSLDGFITGPNPTPENGLGDGGMRLHQWVFPGGDDLDVLGDGRRLFEHLGTEQRDLERIRVLEGEGGVTHLRYRVRR